MPDQSANAANIRANGGYSSDTYVTTPTDTVVFRALINMATITYPVKAITLDTITAGLISTPLVDQEVIIYSGSTSTIKGRLRVADGAGSGSVLQVEEFSAGRLSIADNDKIEVLRSWRVRNKIVEASTSFRKDSRITYSDQGSNPAPICNSGGHWVGFVDDGASVATVVFTGSTSFNVDPDSGATVTHVWSIGDGSFSVGTSTSASPTCTFPVGERWVSHVATDSSNSKSTTQYVYVRVFDQTTTRPTDVSLVDYSGDRQNSWRVRVSVPGGQSLTALPDGALIILWERERRNVTPTAAATVASYGAASTGRSHVKFCGQLIADSISEDPISGTVTFEAVNPIALMKDLPGFSQVLRRRASPTNWRGIKALTTNRALIYMLRWHSSLLTTHDLVLSADNFNYPALYIQANALAEQVREIVDGVDGEWICDRTGRIVVQQNLRYATSAERTAAATIWTATDQDLAEQVDIDRSHRLAYKQCEGRGFTAATTVKGSQPRLSIAPGTAPAEAAAGIVVERLIVTDQTDLNDRTGRRYAAQNNTYNGLPVARGTITFPGAYDIFDFYNEWLKLTLAAEYNKRAIAFSSTRFIIESIAINYDAETGRKTVRLTVGEETDGVAGVTKKIKTPADANLPAFTPPSIDFPYYPPVVDPGVNIGVTAIAVLSETGILYVTTDFNLAEPLWTANTLSFPGTPGVILDFMVDAYSPKYLTGTGAVNGWILTQNRIYYIADIFGTKTITSQLTFGYTSSLRNIHATRITQNHVVAVTNRLGSGGVLAHYTTDGLTWTTVTVTAFYNTSSTALVGGTSGFPGVQLSEHIAGRVYVGAYDNTASNTLALVSLYQSNDYGATWAQTSKISSAAQWPLRGLYIPFHDNADDGVIYYTDNDTGTTIVQARRNADGTTDTIDPIAGANKGAAAEKNFSINAHPLNRQRMVMIAKRPSGSTYFHSLYVTRNAGDDWTLVDAETDVNSDPTFKYCVCDGQNQNTIYALGLGRLAVSYDFGTTILSKYGDIPANTDLVSIIGN